MPSWACRATRESSRLRSASNSASASVPAQDYPTKQVRIIIPFAPGGLNDLIGRMVATHLSEKFGRHVIPENRAGAGGVSRKTAHAGGGA